jgi:hypothetical protein
MRWREAMELRDGNVAQETPSAQQQQELILGDASEAGAQSNVVLPTMRWCEAMDLRDATSDTEAQSNAVLPTMRWCEAMGLKDAGEERESAAGPELTYMHP